MATCLTCNMCLSMFDIFGFCAITSISKIEYIFGKKSRICSRVIFLMENYVKYASVRVLRFINASILSSAY